MDTTFFLPSALPGSLSEGWRQSQSYGESPLKGIVKEMFMMQKIKDFNAEYMRTLFESQAERDRDRVFCEEVLRSLMAAPAAPPPVTFPGICQRYIEV